MSLPFRIEALGKHDRRQFDCGVEALNDYLRTRVGQDVRRRVAACFVAIDSETDRLAGFHTLAAGSVGVGDLPKETAKRLPRYPRVPIVRIERLTVNLRYCGMRLGAALLANAIRRSKSSDIAAYAAVVDAKDDNAVRFYEHHGFMALPSTPRTLFLPLTGKLG